MRRISVSAVVLASAVALSFGSAATAAPVTFDLTGVVGWWSRSGDANAAIPGPPTNGGPCGATGLGSSIFDAQNCFRYPFAAGSSITIDITGSAVTLQGGTLIVDAVTPIVFDTIIFTMHHETTLAGGATGSLDGDSILWTSPAYVNTVGTISCTGPNCGLISMPEGAEFPWQPQFSLLSNTLAAPRLQLMQWDLDASHTAIVGSSTAVSHWTDTPSVEYTRYSGFTFGPTLLGGIPISCGESHAPQYCESWNDPPPWPAPEPGLATLVMLGVGVLTLRARRSGAR